jgi:hypothetical protein
MMFLYYDCSQSKEVTPTLRTGHFAPLLLALVVVVVVVVPFRAHEVFERPID